MQRRTATRAGRGWRKRQLRLIPFTVVIVVAMAALAPLGVASSTEPRLAANTRPSALWKAFPLDVPAPASVATPGSAGLVPPVRPYTPPVVVVRSPDPSGTSPFVVGGLAVLLVGAAGVAFLVLRGPARRWDRAMAAAVSRGRAAAGLSALFRSASASDPSYVLLLPGRGGWGDRVVERMGLAPSLGEVIYDDDLGRVGQAYVVRLVSRSPLPGDKRPCAVLRSL